MRLYHGVMDPDATKNRRQLESLAPQVLEAYQLDRLNDLLDKILPENRFYAKKLAGIELPLRSLEDLKALPFTFKSELVGKSELIDDASSESLAANLTYPAERYARYHQTSGTRGRPLKVLDTEEDWEWWIDTWQYVLDAAQIDANDRAFLAFSFGPFIGFWSARDALLDRGAMVVPGGGMNTAARLEMLKASQATALFCTPTYALRMAEVAQEEGFDLTSLAVRRIVVAGEPGGSLPAVRASIEQAWDAALIDHSGATEVGPWGFGDAEGRGLHVIESEFIAELLEPDSEEPAPEGEVSELVLTSLGRRGAPVVRYRTGDMVRSSGRSEGRCRFLFLEGGILGRSDDMMIVRGVNVFPSAIEQIIRGFPEVGEYRVTVSRERQMDQLMIEVEDRTGQPDSIAEALKLRLGLRIEVREATWGSLPRFEGKAKRFVDRRNDDRG